MKTIWKYEIVPGLNNIGMPKGAKILDVQLQKEIAKVSMWALVDGSKPIETRNFVAYGTGQSMSDKSAGKYIGTFQIDELVFHLFEV